MALLEVKNLGISFGGLRAVDNFNVSIEQGKLYGLIGPNGAGKTTIFNLLTGVYKPTDGIIMLDGQDITGKTTIEINKAGIARTFQNIRLFKGLSVIDNVKNDDKADISTLIRVLKDEEEINNPNLVKCVTDRHGFALYFSRSKIPFERNANVAEFYGHLGIYGYKRKALEAMTTLEQTPLEKAESLEQLRALENGMRIKTSVVDFVPVGIDTKEDLEKFRQIVEAKLQ